MSYSQYHSKYTGEEIDSAIGKAVESVPKTRKVNGKSLSEDINITADDVEAIPSSSLGAPSGVATLGSDGKLSPDEMPEIQYVPAHHANTHASDGEDPITPASIGAAPSYTYSNTDIIAGSTPLADGTLYIVYE